MPAFFLGVKILAKTKTTSFATVFFIFKYLELDIYIEPSWSSAPLYHCLELS